MTDSDDSAMRAACAALRDWQQSPTQTLTPAQPEAATAALQAGLARLAASGLDEVLRRLLADAALPPQVATRDGPPGPVTEDLAALLRPAGQAWDEADEIDWAVRHWQASRAAGLLDEELGADFGEYWRRLEWSGVRLHLRLLGAGHVEERRLLAHLAKVSARYVALAALKRALEARYPELFDLGFSLR
jgi:hypothetical protein